jgi:signal transduction histidine kinase
MLNRASISQQAAGDVEVRGHYHLVPPESQPNATGLPDAVHRLIAVSRACDGPEIEFCDDLAASDLPPELQRAMSSVVRELMSNVICHSRSKKALVGIGQGDGCIFLQVQDWGAGFVPDSVPPERSGLKGIRDMVRRLGGTIDIDSQDGVGTCVIVEVPLSQSRSRSCSERPHIDMGHGSFLADAQRGSGGDGTA